MLCHKTPLASIRNSLNAMFTSNSNALSEQFPDHGWSTFGMHLIGYWRANVLAFLVTAATLGLRIAFNNQLKDRPTLIIFTVPIMLSAYLGGLHAGLLATTLCFFGTSYYLLPPLHSVWIARGVDRFDMFFLMLAGVLISVLNEALHRARQQADIATQDQPAKVVRVNDAVIKSEAQLQTIIENINEAVVVSDLNGQLLHFNHAALEMLGYRSVAEGRRN